MGKRPAEGQRCRVAAVVALAGRGLAKLLTPGGLLNGLNGLFRRPVGLVWALCLALGCGMAPSDEHLAGGQCSGPEPDDHGSFMLPEIDLLVVETCQELFVLLVPAFTSCEIVSS